MLRTHHLALHRVLVAVDLGLIAAGMVMGTRLAAHPTLVWMDTPAGASGAAWAIQWAAAGLAWLLLAHRNDVYRSWRTQSLGREVVSRAEGGAWFVGEEDIRSQYRAGQWSWVVASFSRPLPRPIEPFAEPTRSASEVRIG